jgi:UrcA family protein|tara:strand:- start:150 stop:560 length:411 start_codon:yes stop_codon:yes gene_type:complete
VLKHQFSNSVTFFRFSHLIVQGRTPLFISILLGEAIMNKFIRPLVLTMALAIPAVASAEIESSQVNEVEVRITYTNCDVATSSGRIELERQVRQAAEKVCGPQNLSRTGSIRQLMINKDCFEKAVANALRSIQATG